MVNDLPLLMTRIACGLICIVYGIYKMRHFLENNIPKKEDKLNDKIDLELPTKSFLEQAYSYCDIAQEKLINDFNFEVYDKWYIDQEEAILIFYENNTPKAKAHIQILGTHSKNTASWCWSILNESIAEQSIQKLYPFFQAMHSLEGEWYVNDVSTAVNEAFIRKAVAAGVFLSRGVGYYIAHSPGATAYLILTEIKKL